jgi:peptidoglycan/LPS O-acetylase OafA/YrhL
MAMTQDRVKTLEERDELEKLYRSSPDLEPPRRASLNDWCRRLLVGWAVVIGSIVLFEPAPSNPNAAIPAWGTFLGLAFTAALVAGLAGLSSRRPWGLRASVVAGGLGLAIGAACVLTDHHVGFWGGYEMAAFSGLAATSWFAAKTVE